MDISRKFDSITNRVTRVVSKDSQAGLVLIRSGLEPVLSFAFEALGEELDKEGFFDGEPKNVNELNAFIVKYYRTLIQVGPKKMLWSCDDGVSWRWHDDFPPEFNNPNGKYWFRVAGDSTANKTSFRG